MSRLPRSISLGLLGLVALCGLGCQSKNTYVPPPTPEVTVAVPLERGIVDTFDFTGMTRASATVDLKARVKGYLQAANFDEGAIVEAGQLLFELDPAPYENAKDGAQAALEKSLAQLDLAETNLERFRSLASRNAATQQEVQQAEAQLKGAVADVDAAKATLKQAVLNLGYTKITSPLRGRIGRRLVDPGNLILAETTELAKIESVDPIYVYFNVSEQDWLRLLEHDRRAARPRAAEPSTPDPSTVEASTPDPSTVEASTPEVAIGVGDGTDYPYRGAIDFSEFGIEPGTGTILRRAVVKQPDAALVPGLFVRVRMERGDPRPRLLVEERAISQDQRGFFLLIVGLKGKVEQRIVTLGPPQGPLRVIRSGLAAGEQVVISGLQKARPNSTVRTAVVKMGATPGAAAATDESLDPETSSTAVGPPDSTSTPVATSTSDETPSPAAAPRPVAASTRGEGASPRGSSAGSASAAAAP